MTITINGKRQGLKITNMTKGLAVLTSTRPAKVSISLRSRTMRHLMEDGSSVVDQRILTPIVVDIEFLTPGPEVLTAVNKVTRDRDSLYSINSRGVILQNLRVNVQNVDQEATHLSVMPTKLQFTQLMYQGSTGVVYSQSADSSVINRGIAAIKNAVSTVSNIASSVKQKFTGS